jgi:acyl-CoA synthetase (AMP-forming)/AMP-acid ligase II
MGPGRLIECLEQIEPDGFVAASAAHAVRCVLRRRFPKARLNVTVGRRWFWGGPTLDQLRGRPVAPLPAAAVQSDDPAAVIFTTGSTGPPKGVLYRHGNFDRQAEEIRDFYGIQPGEADVAAFPLFALFSCVMGVTAIIPEMDATRPARVDPLNIVEAVRDWSATQAFGSPAFWNVVGRHCEQHGVKLPTLRRVLSAGAPVPPHVLRRMKMAIHPEGDVHTPYGATEALPVASIAASEVLGQTEARSRQGGGVCVGRRFPGIQWKVIRISDEPIEDISQAHELPYGEVGELIVRGPVVTREYVTRLESNRLHKIRDGRTVWHRMGDVGYLEQCGGSDDARFWYCGRKSHRVLASSGPLYTVPCEAIFNQHECVYRSALVGVGEAGRQRPVVIVEPWPHRRPKRAAGRQRLLEDLRQAAQSHPLTGAIQDFLIRRSLPVDIRHNSKIRREELAEWAAPRVGRLEAVESSAQ